MLITFFFVFKKCSDVNIVLHFLWVYFLKQFAALWWDGSRRSKAHKQLTQEVLTKIWEDSPEIVEVTGEYCHPLFNLPLPATVSWLYNAVVMFHDYTMLWWCFMTIQCCGDVSWLYNAVVMFHDYTMLWWCFMTIQCCGDVSRLYNAVVMFHDYTMLWWCSGLHVEVCMLGMQMLGDMNCMWGKRCYQEFNPWQWEAQWSPSSNNLRLFNLFTNLLFCRNALPGYHKVERKKLPSDLTPVPYLRIKFGMHAFFENDNRYFEPVSVAASDWNRNCIPWQTDQWCCSGSQQRTQPQKWGLKWPYRPSQSWQKSADCSTSHCRWLETLVLLLGVLE